jgi:hypothetical protein
MKSVVGTVLLALSPAVSAWSFTYGPDGAQGVGSGSANQGCKGIYHPSGATFEWDRGFFEDCCIHLYGDGNCQAQVGLSCPDWEKTASQDLWSYKVTDC